MRTQDRDIRALGPYSTVTAALKYTNLSTIIRFPFYIIFCRYLNPYISGPMLLTLISLTTGSRATRVGIDPSERECRQQVYVNV